MNDWTRETKIIEGPNGEESRETVLRFGETITAVLDGDGLHIGEGEEVQLSLSPTQAEALANFIRPTPPPPPVIPDARRKHCTRAALHRAMEALQHKGFRNPAIDAVAAEGGWSYDQAKRALVRAHDDDDDPITRTGDGEYRMGPPESAYEVE